MPLTIRHMGLTDLAMVLDWAAEEGWNPGLDDAGPLLRSDPEGFYLAELDGQPVAAISVVNHSDSFAFLGLYICRQAFRGRGYAYELWQSALKHAGTRTIGLDGVPAQQDSYRKSGFLPAGSTLRMMGEIDSEPDAAVRRLQPGDIPRLIEADAAANGYRREMFLRGWLEDTPTRLSVVLAPAGTPEGFATIRRCRSGAKAGPVVASDAERGLRLLKAAAACLAEENIIVDVPAHNGNLLALLRSRGFRETFPTARMYRGKQPEQNGFLQAVGTLELG